jgi:hypothetical protein
MNSAKPPRLAAWILQEFGPELNQEALAGDLNEAFQQGRSKAWYWRQVLAAIRWRRLIRPLLASALIGWWMTSPGFGFENLLSRPIDMAVITAACFASLFLPGIMRRRFRFLLVLMIAAIFALFWHYNPHVAKHHAGIFFWVASNFVFYRERSAFATAPYHLSVRELVYGDPNAERQRLLEKLHLTMLQETDPEVRRAYAESIVALQRHESTDAKAT